MDFKIPDKDDLTMDELNDIYKDIIKRFGWVAISTKNSTQKDTYKKEINDIIGKAIRKRNIIRDEDKLNDINIIIKKLNDATNILDIIHKNNRKK